MTRLGAILLVLVLVAAACGDDDGASPAGDQQTQGSGDGGDGGGTGSDGASDGGDDTGGDGNTVGDDEDAAEILGDPDLDLDDLPDDVAGALDDIDDVVSVGDCSSDTVGLAITAPDGWQCRVLDQPVGGLDGFTLFTEGNELNITIGTPSPFGSPCEVLNLCDTTTPIDLSDEFPDTQILEVAGTVTIWGTHRSVEAEVVVTSTTGLSADELAFVSMVLDSTVQI